MLNVAKRDNAGLRRVHCPDSAAIANIDISERKAGLLVIGLLRHDAIKPDHPCAGMGDCLLPDAQAVAAPAQIRAHDVETEEGEAFVVIDAGDDGGRLAFEFADEKAAPVDRHETVGIGKAGIPSLGRGPVDGKRDFFGTQGSDVQTACLGR